jgi:hypothetical protein
MFYACGDKIQNNNFLKMYSSLIIEHFRGCRALALIAGPKEKIIGCGMQKYVENLCKLWSRICPYSMS